MRRVYAPRRKGAPVFRAYGVPTYGLSAAQLAEWDAWLVDQLPPRGKIGIEWDGQRQNILNAVWPGATVTDNEIEQQIQSKGLTAPRVTLAQIESTIAYEYYITGDQLPNITTAVLGPSCAQVPTQIDISPLACLTLCVLVLKNGFKVTGESSCVDPANFDAELGRKIARQMAIDKVWMLEGYALKQRLHDGNLYEHEVKAMRGKT